MYCSIKLIGRISSKPELKFTREKNIPFCEFDIAVNPNIKNKNSVDFYPIIVWGEYAKTISSYRYLGMLIFVSGSGTFDSWVDNETGKHMKKFKVNSNNVIFLNFKKDNNDELDTSSFGGDYSYDE